MARALRVEFEGAMYHVTVRGVNRQRLLLGDWDRVRLLKKLEEGVERYELDVFLYCLMSNHFHLLVGTPRGNLGRFMGWLLTAYTVYFNRKYNRSGHLTQGRYGAKLVEGDEYLLKLSRYIHLNPVQTAALKSAPVEERVAALRAYPWSSFPGYVSARRAKDFVRYDPLLELVGKGRKNKRLAYRAFVEQGLGLEEAEWNAMQEASRLAIGSATFIEKIEDLYAGLLGKRTTREDVAFRRPGKRLAPDVVLKVVANSFEVQVAALRRPRRGVWDRAVAARCLVQFSGLTQREVAEQLGVRTGAAVSAQLGQLQEALESNRTLRALVREIDERLQRRL